MISISDAFRPADLLPVYINHAAYPDTGIDAIMIASKVVDALHSIVSRYVSPLQEAVLTLGTIQGGSRNNIIADEVKMTGTIRTTNPRVRAEIAERVRAIVSGISAALGGSGEVEIRPGYAALINHDWVVDLVAEEAAALMGPNPSSGGTRRAWEWRTSPSSCRKGPAPSITSAAAIPGKASARRFTPTASTSTKTAFPSASPCRWA